MLKRVILNLNFDETKHIRELLFIDFFILRDIFTVFELLRL